MAARSRRDLVARDRLVERYLRLAYMLARRYSRTSEPLKDLEQVACLGLVHAVDRFDPDRGTTFSTFAVPTILGELRRHFRDRTWSVRVPRDLRDAATAVEEDGGATLGDRIRAGEDELRRAEDSILVRQLAAASLSERDREVLRLRFEEGLLQREIAARVGVSQMQVSRVLRDSLRRLQLVARQGAAPPAGGAVLPRRDARDPIVRLEGPVGRARPGYGQRSWRAGTSVPRRCTARLRAAPPTYRGTDRGAALHSRSVGRETDQSTPSGELRCEIGRDGQTAWVQPHGELDLDSVHRVDAALEELRADGCRDLVLDLRGLTFMDSTGLRLAIRWDTAARDDGFGFAIVPGREVVQRVLRLTGMADHLRVAELPPET